MAGPEIVMVPLERLVEDFKLYPRTQVQPPHVSQMAEALRAGEQLPPIVVEAETYRIVDGWHRKRAHEKAGLAEIACILRSYASEADLFEEAIRLNATHGRPLAAYERKRCIQIAQELGLSLERTAAALRIRPEAAVKMFERAPLDESGRVVAVKQGLPSVTPWTSRMQQVNEKYGGMQPTFYARQLILYLEGGFFRADNRRLAELLDQLCALWERVKQQAGVRAGGGAG